jgi:NAD(P)-dependent dehydrogenase (short-subunit alcohol dehydrogenase family)
MSFAQQALKTTIAAIAFGFPHKHVCGSWHSVSAYSSGFSASLSLLNRCQRSNIHQFSRSRNKATQRRLSSHFTAPDPPQSKGVNVFQDIDFSVSEKPHSHSAVRNSDPNAVFVVTGASRGIGLQFVKKLLFSTKGSIVACCRSPSTSSGLQDFLSNLDEEQQRRVEVLQLDVERQESIENTSFMIKDKYDRVDLLLNVAGILGDGKNVPGPERSLSKIDRRWMEKTFQVNVIGPVMFSKEIAPLMSKNRQQRVQRKDRDVSQTQSERPIAIIANLSARVGSISDNGLGGWYSYRMSKAALNQATRTMSIELKRQSVWCVALHPGTTDTDLSKPFQQNVREGRLFPVDFTVESLLKVIDCLEAENSGGLYDWAGKAIPF